MAGHPDNDTPSEQSSNSGSSSAKVPTPSETDAGIIEAVEDASDQTTLSGTGHAWWMDVPSSVALFTPIPAPCSLLGHLPRACLPSPNFGMRDNADAAFRPLSFDVAVHAAFRISEAATLAQVAAERVAVWAKTREPPYTALNEHSMQELQAAIPIMKVAVKMASTTLYNDLRLVQPREDLWYPPATQKTGDRGQDEDEDNISIILDRFWWISSYEGDVVQIMAAQAVLDLHKATATGRDSWRKETQQLVKEMKLAQSFMKTALDDSSRGMKKATSARIVGAIKHAAGAVKQLTALAESTASAVFFHRFWQWGAWITGPKTISPSEAAAYTLAKLEAKETLARTKKAAAQAVAAAEAVEDYKHEV